MQIATLYERSESGVREREVLPTLLTRFPDLKRVLEQHGVNIPSLRCIGGTVMGTGSQGQAYSDGNLVVKVTEDESEAQACAAARAKGGVSGTIKIHYVGRLAQPIKWPYGLWQAFPNMPGPQYYIIIQELLDTNLTATERGVIDEVGGWVGRGHNSKRLFRLAHTFRGVPPHKVAQIAAKTILADNRAQEELEIATQILEAVIRLYQEAGVRFFDIHPGNVGKSGDGRYHLFDLGISQIEQKQTLATIESVHRGE